MARKRSPWKRVLSNVKNNGRTINPRGQRLKEIAHTVNITADDIEKQFIKQGGRCFWWGYELDPNWVFVPYHNFAVSVDRLDNNGEYELDNFVVCCRAANLARHVCPANRWAKMCISMSKARLRPLPEALKLAESE